MGFKKLCIFSFWASLLTFTVADFCQASASRSAVMGNHPVIQPNTTHGRLNRLNALYLPGVIWFDDEENIYLNPALVNDQANAVRASFGNYASPQVLVVSSFAPLTFGVGVNRRLQPLLGQPGVSWTRFSNVAGRENPVGTGVPFDLFLGIDYGLKLGMHFGSAHGSSDLESSPQVKRKATAYQLDFGLDFVGIQPFLGFVFETGYQEKVSAGPSPTQTQALTQSRAGIRASISGWNPYFVWNQQREEILPHISQTTLGATITSFGLGMGRDYKVPLETWETLSGGLHVFGHLGFWHAHIVDSTDIGAGGYNNADWHRWILPANLGAEYDANDWLIVRAGVAYDFFHFVVAQEGSATLSHSRTFQERGQPRFRGGAKFHGFLPPQYGDDLSLEFAFGQGVNSQAVQLGAYLPSDGSMNDSSLGLGRLDKNVFLMLSANYEF